MIGATASTVRKRKQRLKLLKGDLTFGRLIGGAGGETMVLIQDHVCFNKLFYRFQYFLHQHVISTLLFLQCSLKIKKQAVMIKI